LRQLFPPGQLCKGLIIAGTAHLLVWPQTQADSRAVSTTEKLAAIIGHQLNTANSGSFSGFHAGNS
jgi:hypothetical protein